MKIKLEFDTSDNLNSKNIDSDFLPQRGHLIRWDDNRYYIVSEIVFEREGQKSELFIPVLHLTKGREILSVESDPVKLKVKFAQ
jgi:hypothetical protein